MQQLDASFSWDDFLSRPRLPQADPAQLRLLRGARILITGAGGSIGSALALRLAKLAPQELVLLETAENSLHALNLRLRDEGCTAKAAGYLGSVTDEALLDEVFAQHEPEWVFHAAAHKHVALLEEHPLAALGNNVLGTLAVAQRAQAVGSRLVFLSTDKAAAPACILGASKRLAERIVLDAHFVAGGCAVRLGNVLGSRGSVVDRFREQIARGGPITITSSEARRYWLTLEESTELLLSAAVDALERPGMSRLLVPDVGVTLRVADLAKFLAARLSPERDVAIEYTGLLPGEKLVEVLWSGTEQPSGLAHNGLRTIATIATTPLALGDLETGSMELRMALAKRHLPTALAIVRRLVPEYAPSSRMLEAVGESAFTVTA